MINVNDVKIFIDSIANKEQSGNAYSIEQLNNWFYAASTDLFKQRYGLPEDYVPGMPIPKMGYEVTQKMKDDLRACKEVVYLPVDDKGIMQLPDNYVHKTAIIYEKIINKCCGQAPDVFPKPVDILDDDKWAERCDNSIKFPTLDFPIANFLKDSIRFKPENLKQVQFSYLRHPNRPKWAYTAPNGVEVYDPQNSVNFDWDEILFTDIARLVLGYLSINLRDSELKQAVEMYKNKGV